MERVGEAPNPGDLILETLRGNPRVRQAIWNTRKSLEAVALAARGGDHRARNALWLVTRPQLERIALAVGANPDDIPDIVQETLLAADSHLDRFDPARGSFRTWLAAILIHRRNNQFRSRARQAHLVRDLKRVHGANGNGRARLEVFEARVEVRRLLYKLSRRQRNVLWLFGIGGLTAYEAGLILGLTPPGVRSIAREARRRLARPGQPLKVGGGLPPPS